MTNKITTLLFDIGDVLIDIDWQRGYRKLLGAMAHDDGRAYTLDEITELLHPGPYGSVWDDFGMNKLTADGFLDLIINRAKYKGDRILLQTALTELFEPLPERITLLNRYALDPNLKVALVSDTNSMHMNHIETYIPDIFANIPKERRFYSYNAKLKKKLGSDFYRFVLDTLQVEPQTALMIDDREQNRPGAEAIGLNFLLIQKHEDLEQALASYLA